MKQHDDGFTEVKTPANAEYQPRQKSEQQNLGGAKKHNIPYGMILIVAIGFALYQAIPIMIGKATDAVVDGAKNQLSEVGGERTQEAMDKARDIAGDYAEKAKSSRIAEADPNTEIAATTVLDAYSDPGFGIPAGVNTFEDLVSNFYRLPAEYEIADAEGIVTIRDGVPDRKLQVGTKSLYIAYFTASGLDPADLGKVTSDRVRGALPASEWRDGGRGERKDELMTFLTRHAEPARLTEIELLELSSVIVPVGWDLIVSPHEPVLLDLYSSYGKRVEQSNMKIYLRQRSINPLKKTETGIPIQFIQQGELENGQVFQMPAQRIVELEELGLYLIHAEHYRRFD